MADIETEVQNLQSSFLEDRFIHYKVETLHATSLLL